MHHSSSEDLEDRDRLTGFEDEWTLSKDQEVTKRPQGDLSGPEGRPRICMGPDKRAVAPVIWLPRDEVVDFWNQSQSIMKKNVREYLLSICPRPTLPNNSCVTPELNPSIKALVTPNQVKAYAISSHYWQLIHTEVLNMLAPAMTIYEMAAESIRKQVPVDPRELREWVRCVIRYIGSITKRLQLQCCCSALEAINPQLKRMATKMSAPTADGLLFAEDKAKLLKRIIQSFPELENEAEDMNVEHSRTAPRPKDERRKRGSRKLGTRPQDGAAQLQELRSARPSSTAEARRDNEAPLELWHRRFAHRDPKLILEMQNRNLAVGMKVSESDTGSPASCAICLQIKGSGTPSPPKTERRSAEVLDLIHVVLQEPFRVSSRENRRCSLTFVDDFSRYCVNFLLAGERELEASFNMFISWLNQTVRRLPKAFQIDDVAVGLLDSSQDLLEKKGIVLRRSDGESPEASGSARGEITSLLEMTRCMLADAQLPEKFWGDALMTATYLLNRLPANGTGKTPFEVWYGRVPRLDHIRVFGTLAYADVLPQEWWDARPSTERAIFLGYVPCTFWYKVMNLETGHIHRRETFWIAEEEKVDPSEVVLQAPASLKPEGQPSLGTDLVSNSLERRYLYKLRRRPKRFVKVGATRLEELLAARPFSTVEPVLDNVAPLELWHRRFAHRDPESILEMQNRNLAVGMKVSESDTGSPDSCAICLQIKGSGTHSPPRTERRSAEVLELIHVVLQEPFRVASRENRRFFVAFVDDFSRYCVTYPLSEETELEASIKVFVKWVNQTVGRLPKAFQVGDGAEGLSDSSQAFLKEKGIELRKNDAQSPEPTGTTPPEITSLLEMTRCMLADAQLPSIFWSSAFTTATYLLNRLPADGTGKTPFELWVGHVPSLYHIRTFGSLAYVYAPLKERHDPSLLTEQAVFLTYHPGNRAYNVMILETGIVRIRDVVCFVEDEKADRRDLVIEASERLPQEGGSTPDTDPGSNSVQEEEAEAPAEHQTPGEGGRDVWGEPMPVDESLVSQKVPAISSSSRPAHRASAPGSNCPANSLPGSWEEVERMPATEGTRWREAARKELEALHQCEAWSLTELPAGQAAAGCKWVFAAKPEPEGESYSARPVADGSLPKGGEDPAETGSVLLPVSGDARPSCAAEAEREDEAPLELWHRRFAHRDPKLILEMQNRNLAVGMKVSESDTGSPASCAICLDIKGSGTPSPPKTERRSAAVLDLIHGCLHGPFHVPSREDKRYFLLFVDDFSRYCVAYQLDEKTETAEAIRNYFKWLRAKSRRLPKTFEIANEAVGLLDSSQALLEEEGIVLRKNDAQSPELTGTAPAVGSSPTEITSLLEMTRCMLADAQLPDMFWGDAIMTATYLLNRLPADDTGKTPYELWHGHVPSLDHIRVFGRPAFAYVPLWERQQVGSETQLTVFLGYIPGSSMYQVMEIDTGNIRGRDVVCFMEEEKEDESEVVLEASECPSQEVGETGNIPGRDVVCFAEEEKEDQSEVVLETSENVPQELGTPLDTDPGSNSVQEEEAGMLVENQTPGEGGRDAGGKPVPVDEALVPQKGPAVRSSPQPDHRSLAPGSICPTNSLPGSWEEVERMPASEGARWREAARKELETLHQHEAWSLTQLPAGQTAVGCKWVFAAKPEPEGESYSARLVAEGFLPKGGEDPAETFALAVQECTLRMLQGLATSRQMQVRHLEVTAEVAGELYMEQPPGFANQEHPGWVYKLKKNLFGLKEAAQAQNEKLKAVLLQEGFKQDRTDPCLYSRSRNGHLSFIFACAEDLVVATQREQEYTEIVHQLSGQVDVRELGDATHYLATQMKSDRLDLLEEENENI